MTKTTHGTETVPAVEPGIDDVGQEKLKWGFPICEKGARTTEPTPTRSWKWWRKNTNSYTGQYSGLNTQHGFSYKPKTHKRQCLKRNKTEQKTCNLSQTCHYWRHNLLLGLYLMICSIEMNSNSASPATTQATMCEHSSSTWLLQISLHLDKSHIALWYVIEQILTAFGR